MHAAISGKIPLFLINHRIFCIDVIICSDNRLACQVFSARSVRMLLRKRISHARSGGASEK
jgi:hypothetical protein